jgi:hypothetical protein
MVASPGRKITLKLKLTPRPSFAGDDGIGLYSYVSTLSAGKQKRRGHRSPAALYFAIMIVERG